MRCGRSLSVRRREGANQSGLGRGRRTTGSRAAAASGRPSLASRAPIASAEQVRQRERAPVAWPGGELSSAPPHLLRPPAGLGLAGARARCESCRTGKARQHAPGKKRCCCFHTPPLSLQPQLSPSLCLPLLLKSSVVSRHLPFASSPCRGKLTSLPRLLLPAWRDGAAEQNVGASSREFSRPLLARINCLQPRRPCSGPPPACDVQSLRRPSEARQSQRRSSRPPSWAVVVVVVVVGSNCHQSRPDV